VLVFGDSITAGYGVEPSEAYPSRLQEKIKAKGWPFTIVNGGISGDTTASGLSRLNWALRSEPEVMIIALGGNDGLRGTAPETTKKNLQAIIDNARKARPAMTLILCGMRMPPNYGEAYTRRYAAIFDELARKNQIAYVPFLLDKVGGIAAMNQPDRIHPNPAGHRLIADTVWRQLEPVLRARQH
jgi:acyl-CoA thioesterase-1